ncbi:phosphatase PAP2 family protein [Sphingomonas sp.]|uniref:phosphatase PAP2 family protein n=1 Tax=Sphingomonas sp. TaxID=28214 RepID=UPI0035BC6FB0
MSKIGRAAKAERTATHKAAQERDTWPVRIAGAASEVADQPPLVALSAGTIVLGAVLRRPAVMRAGLRMLASHALATGIKTVLKTTIDRTRPNKAMRDGHHIGKGSGTDDTDLNSFPSGHTAGAVAIAQAVARDAPAAAIPVRLAAGAVAAIQMPRGKHYISDVLAGAAIGWVSEMAASAALRAGERRLREAWARYAAAKTNSEPT